MLRRLRYGAHGAYRSSICHYCGKKATTSDHIVPRGAFPVHQSALPYWFRAHNIVPSCQPCNNFKADYRSDCECGQCTWVWSTAIGMCLLKPDWQIRRRWVIRAGQSRL